MSIQLPLRQEPDNVHGIVDVAVQPELALDVFIAEEAGRRWELLAVDAQKTAIERDRRKERCVSEKLRIC